VSTACAKRVDPLVEPLLALSELQYDAGVLMTKAEDIFAKGEYEQAAPEYERFLELHPVHRWAPHAQFKLALCYEHRVPKVGRDPALAEKALAAFERVLSYADTRYHDVARAKALDLRRRLAESEFKIGQFYFKQGQYPAAIGRFQRVLDAKVGERVTEDAGYYLAVAYERDGQREQAAAAANALMESFPQSRHADSVERLRARLASGAS
jgi:outer membrane protein assembly factor BamD